jgi:hypothetical protein
MSILQSIITVLYYVLVGYIAVIMLWNFKRTKEWEKELLYLIVLLPFLLRLFRLK